MSNFIGKQDNVKLNKKKKIYFVVILGGGTYTSLEPVRFKLIAFSGQ